MLAAAPPWLVVIAAGAALVVFTIVFLASRYKRCPSDKILVIYGKVGDGVSARCIHGGAALVWPLIQDFMYLDLQPLQVAVPTGDGSPGVEAVVQVTTDPGLMMNAAERLLGLPRDEIAGMAVTTIGGELARHRTVGAAIRFSEEARRDVEAALAKIGLALVSVFAPGVPGAPETTG